MKHPKLLLGLSIFSLVAALRLCTHAGSISGSVRVDLNMTHSSTTTLSTAFETLPTLVNDTYTTGTTNNQMNYVWYGRRVIPTNTGLDSIDIIGGITDSFGQTVSLPHVRFLAVQAVSNNAGVVGLFGNGSGAVQSFTEGTNVMVKIWPGMTFFVTCPTYAALTNAAAVSDVIALTNYATASGATVDVWIGGSNP